jgi:hypothetical protein
MELLGAYEARRLALSEPDTSAIVARLHAPLRCWGAIHGSLIRLEPARLEHFGCFRRF